MIKRTVYLLILIPLVFGMVGCSSVKLPAIFSKDGQTEQNQAVDQMDLSKQPVENKLAVGILALEGTDQAVTAEEAKNLLPLWKAVNSLNKSQTASNDEITALYTQIEETMTAEQVQKIKDLTLTQEEMQALMQKYGGTMGGRPQGMDPSSMTEEQKATLEALRQSNNGGNAGGGRFAGGGDMPGNGGGFPGGGGMPGDGGGFPGGTMPNAQGTPSADQAFRQPRAGGLNILLVEPVIKLLEERAGG